MDTLNEGTPFTPQEKEVMDLLIQAHNKFCELQKGNTPYIKHGYDWLTYLHRLQDVIIVGATMRKYPDYFNIQQ
jgi:hypothetical protein